MRMTSSSSTLRHLLQSFLPWFSLPLSFYLWSKLINHYRWQVMTAKWSLTRWRRLTAVVSRARLSQPERERDDVLREETRLVSMKVRLEVKSCSLSLVSQEVEEDSEGKEGADLRQTRSLWRKRYTGTSSTSTVDTLLLLHLLLLLLFFSLSLFPHPSSSFLSFLPFLILLLRMGLCASSPSFSNASFSPLVIQLFVAVFLVENQEAS